MIVIVLFFSPFDPTTYEDEIDEDEVLDEEGRTRLKLKVKLIYVLFEIHLAIQFTR